jgi:hypothetical protein
MMFFILIFTLIFTFVVYIIINLYNKCYNFIKFIIFNKKLYKYEHIPSYGDIPFKYEWHKTDDEAKNSKLASWGDFIYEVYPKQNRIKPNN